MRPGIAGCAWSPDPRTNPPFGGNLIELLERVRQNHRGLGRPPFANGGFMRCSLAAPAEPWASPRRTQRSSRPGGAGDRLAGHRVSPADHGRMSLAGRMVSARGRRGAAIATKPLRLRNISIAIVPVSVHSAAQRSSSTAAVVWFSIRSPAVFLPSSPRCLELRPTPGGCPQSSFSRKLKTWQQAL